MLGVYSILWFRATDVSATEFLLVSLTEEILASGGDGKSDLIEMNNSLPLLSLLPSCVPAINNNYCWLTCVPANLMLNDNPTMDQHSIQGGKQV